MRIYVSSGARAKAKVQTKWEAQGGERRKRQRNEEALVVGKGIKQDNLRTDTVQKRDYRAVTNFTSTSVILRYNSMVKLNKGLFT